MEIFQIVSWNTFPFGSDTWLQWSLHFLFIPLNVLLLIALAKGWGCVRWWFVGSLFITILYVGMDFNLRKVVKLTDDFGWTIYADPLLILVKASALILLFGDSADSWFDPRQSGDYTPRKKLVLASKILLCWASVFVGILIFSIVYEGVLPAGLATLSVHRAEALLSEKSQFHELPNKVIITFDGERAEFYKNTTAFDDLVKLLRRGRAEATTNWTGDLSETSKWHLCGELAIPSYGIRSSFIILRSQESKNCYLIRFPKLTSFGESYPNLTLDSGFADFIKSHAN